MFEVAEKKETVAGFFPPFQTIGQGQWLESVFGLVRYNTWFWCDSSRTEAEQFLSRAQVGTFVIRFANEASFRLSIRTAHDTSHFKIRHKYQSPHFYVKGIESLNHSFESLLDLAKAVANHLQVELHSPSYSPFGHLFIQK